jgi:hypothetical protein
MSDEARIDPELKGLEAALQGLLLPASQLSRGSSRDDLMYQAGWAAAMTASKNTQVELPARVGVRSQRWVWPTATTIVSGIAILLAALLILQPNAGSNQATVEVAGSDLSKPVNLSSDRQRESDSLANHDREPPVDLVQYVLDMPRDQALSSRLVFQNGAEASGLRCDSSDLPTPDRRHLTTIEKYPNSPTTREQLLDELLPDRDRQPMEMWRGFSLFSTSN